MIAFSCSLSSLESNSLTNCSIVSPLESGSIIIGCCKDKVVIINIKAGIIIILLLHHCSSLIFGAHKQLVDINMVELVLIARTHLGIINNMVCSECN